MIVVKVEIWPHGEPKYRRMIGVMKISNTLMSKVVGKGDYRVKWRTFDDNVRGNWQQTRLEGHDRSEGFWELLRAACEKVVKS